MARRMLTISVAALTLALSGCAPSGGLVIDGGAPDHGRNTYCMGITNLGREIAFGASLLNESDVDISITNVELLAVNTVLISEIAIASAGTNESGWGVVAIDELPATHVSAWESRTPAIGRPSPQESVPGC